MKNSKIDENERLSSTKMLIDSSSKSIKANVQNSSVALSEIGRTYYEKALPFAFAAAESTINLYGATSRTIQNITNNSGGSNLNSLLSNFKEGINFPVALIAIEICIAEGNTSFVD